VGGEWEMKALLDETQERMLSSRTTAWLRKEAMRKFCGDQVVRKRGNENVLAIAYLGQQAMEEFLMATR
jgi:hypothetical protein